MGLRTLNVTLAISLDPVWEDRLRRLISEIDQEPHALAGQNERAVLALMLYEAEIQSVSLSPPLETLSGSEQNHQFAEPLRQWTLDTSKPVYMSWNDGASLTVPPRRG